MTPIELKTLQANLGLSESAMCAYLGISPGGLRKWIAGTRKPDGAAVRLFHVLHLVHQCAPILHDRLIADTAPAAPDQPMRADRTPALPDMPECLKTPHRPVPAIPDWLKIAV